MKIKKILVSAISAALISTSVFSVGAVENKSTGTIYMGGYELRGSVTAYPINAYGYTYCEKKDAGKKANTYFAYYDTSGKLRECGIVSKNFVYNGQVGLNKKTPSPNTDIFDYYAGAMTVVKSYILIRHIITGLLKILIMNSDLAYTKDK